MRWKARTAMIDLVPVAFLNAEQQLHEIRADGEVARVSADDKAAEVAHVLARWIESLRDQRDDVVADGVLLRMQLEQRDVLADVDERAAGILANHLIRAPKCCRTRNALRLLNRFVAARLQIIDTATVGSVTVP